VLAADPSPAKVDLFMPWFISDYLASTALFTTLEHGAYSLLLMHMWAQGGTLPLDHDRLAQVARVRDADQWAKIWQEISVRFVTAGPGRITHRRLQAELEEARRLKTEASERGRAGAAGRWPKYRAKLEEAAEVLRKPSGEEVAAVPSTSGDPCKAGVSDAHPGDVSRPKTAHGSASREVFALGMPEQMPGHCPSNALQSPSPPVTDPDPERVHAGPEAGAGAWPEQKSGTVHQLVLRARGQPSLCDFHVGGVNVGRPAVPPRLPGCDECVRIRAAQLAARARPRPPDTPQTAGEILGAGGWPPREPRKGPHRAHWPSTERQSELFEDRRGS
jgi:uncharacterized protein YdaU (DUF1376 family)